MTDDHSDQIPAAADADADAEAIDDLLIPVRHVVLSPHYDDMPLSMGATAARLAAAGRLVTDLVVFGAEPVGVDLHRFAADHHIAWGLSAAEVIAARRTEEAAATSILATGSDTLSLFDAIYRGDHYTSDARLFGPPASAEDGLPARIVAEAIAATPRDADTGGDAGVRYYAPLAVGGHVDHRLAFRAARLLHEAGHEVWLYEDLPYAMIGSNLSERLEAIAAEGLAIEVAARVPVAVAWDRKLDAIMAYPSQLQTVFGNYAGVDPTRPAIAGALERYHRRLGDDQPVERFWRFTPDAG